VHRLESAGFITGYRARIDLCHQASPVPLLNVWTEFYLADDLFEARTRFEEAVQGIPQVVECWNITGDGSYLVRFMVNDIEDYRELLDQLQGSDLAIVKYVSHVVLRRVKGPIRVPVRELLENGRFQGPGDRRTSAAPGR
jgi:Lrp/AsnC family transcriptional regulator of ectoine degradation